MKEVVINLAYLLASAMFVIGLKGLTHPRTAVRGNLTGALGMLLAIVVTLIDQRIIGYEVIIAGAVVGGLIGAVFAIKIQMTAMPQMVALFNGFGGGASVLVAGAALIESGIIEVSGSMTQLVVATVFSGLIGSVTFWGSLIAMFKLWEKVVPGGNVTFPGLQVVNAILAIICVALGVMIIMDPTNITLYWGLVAAAGVMGILLTIPIGGADMPVVIALLNSYSGLAAAATGFVLSNNVLIIAGSLVGASGLILTSIMCKAMNRSLANVIFGKLAPAEGAATADEVYAGKVKAASPEEVAMLFDTARRVVFVPGYGMAVAQAQHVVRDLANWLTSNKGAEVEYAIHPVAGRMPGHMNVLLAEANVPYDQLKEMDEINPTLDTADVAMVIGANDVVNPVARTDPKSPIAGMPIIDVDKCRTVVIVKRSLSPGFAGIPNPLFAADNTLMMFGDGKKALLELVAALKEG
ncbi:MAG: NAD(P)(+) transhydrogenase (Re/Si-specific) subunit beta [Candidatus Latescibacterota bacterium]|nr:MAG: NAD(P)(+) transhydrogenase (Re/Si-specific) subunit beta [Candidatus Latescibacterota bacterium]